MKKGLFGLLFTYLILLLCTSPKTAEDKCVLKKNWSIQSSAVISENGQSISVIDYDDGTWYPVEMPSTVLAALVKNEVYPDPYYGTNIEEIPGYRKGGLRIKDLPEDSPFNVPWWYRTEFTLPAGYKNKTIVPMWLFSIIIGIVSYTTVMYYY